MGWDGVGGVRRDEMRWGGVGWDGVGGGGDGMG